VVAQHGRSAWMEVHATIQFPLMNYHFTHVNPMCVCAYVRVCVCAHVHMCIFVRLSGGEALGRSAGSLQLGSNLSDSRMLPCPLLHHG
jgi:hypothetical protein